MEKTASQRILFIIAGYDDIHKSLDECMSSKFGQIRPKTTELAAHEGQKKLTFL